MSASTPGDARSRGAFERARLAPYGESALWIDLGLEDAAFERRARLTHAAAGVVRALFPRSDVVVGGGVLGVLERAPQRGDEQRVREALARVGEAPSGGGRLHVLQAVYDGPDLPALAESLGRSREDIVRLHCERELLVELVGFLPGFGYLGPVAPELVVPRRPAPRARVAAGSLALAGSFSGVYPFDSPGGWTLLGRVPRARLFDPDREEPLLWAPGDRVRFEAVEVGDLGPAEPRLRPLAPAAKEGPALVVERAPVFATVQDRGRRGQLHRGLPPSGPLDPETAALANAAVGNEPSAALLEIVRGELAARARGELLVSVDGEPARRLRDGEPFVVPEARRAVRYLAILGGIDVPARLGSRSTLFVARLGGLAGRPVRPGDVLPCGAAPLEALPRADQAEHWIGDDEPLPIDPGPHLARFPRGALEVLLREEFRVSRLGDRIGQRLEGPAIPREGLDLALPAPLVRGALQITTDGTPIVLGPDHPATGGYPLLAVLRASAWGALARKRPGDPVRFVLGDGPARAVG